MAIVGRCATCGRRHKRSNPQNALYWALLGQMAERSWPDPDSPGKTRMYDSRTFHRYYAGRILGREELRLPNGETLTIVASTAGLDTEQFSDYFEQVQADAAMRGVFLADLETA